MTCKVDGCLRGKMARGLCPTHYRRLRRYGDPLGTKSGEPQMQQHVDAPAGGVLYDPEIWVRVPGLHCREVSTHGRIRIAPTTVKTVSGVVKTLSRRLCHTKLSQHGYPVIGVNGRPIFVHRCVALAFCKGYEEGLHVNHKDGRKRNNRPENLEWVTNAENVRHAHFVLGVHRRERK